MGLLTVKSQSFNYFTNDLLRLPRELRDLIYTQLVTGLMVYELNDTDILPNINNLQLREELLEAFFSNVTCSIRHTNYLPLLNESCLRENGWTYPEQSSESIPSILDQFLQQSSIWGAYTAYKPYIRRLEVQALEVELTETELLRLERECSVLRPEVRAEWTELLDLPRLEDLCITLSKTSPIQFHWANFSPILYELRARLPKLQITFDVDFDIMLHAAWDADGWDDGIHVYPQFLGNGLVRVMGLVEPPSEEDRVYVDRYCTRKLETKGRNAIDGLLGEEPDQRRLLIPHYVVKEAALARVLMEEHYRIYKIARETAAGKVVDKR
ncbi:hypothetical protein NX059_000716 [Plenodomus lindquistii]|nr:hypothetical protein NX059_000716 [Plenodomus lindquistii]